MVKKRGQRKPGYLSPEKFPLYFGLPRPADWQDFASWQLTEDQKRERSGLADRIRKLAEEKQALEEKHREERARGPQNSPVPEWCDRYLERYDELKGRQPKRSWPVTPGLKTEALRIKARAARAKPGMRARSTAGTCQ